MSQTERVDGVDIPVLEEFEPIPDETLLAVEALARASFVSLKLKKPTVLAMVAEIRAGRVRDQMFHRAVGMIRCLHNIPCRKLKHQIGMKPCSPCALLMDLEKLGLLKDSP